MVIQFCRIRFNRDSNSKYYIKPITDIKKNLTDEIHISPVNETDFDSKGTYYCKYNICQKSCIENHLHYKYYPCRIFLLGESEETINGKLNQKRCSIPKVPSDLGEIRSTRNENVLKETVKQGNKNAKAKKASVKHKRNKAVLNAITKTFVDSDDDYSESSETSNYSTQSAKVIPVSVRVEKLNTHAASQQSTSHQSQLSRPSTFRQSQESQLSTSHQSQHSQPSTCRESQQFQYSENVENNCSHRLRTEDVSSCSFPTIMKEAVPLQSSRKKLKTSSYEDNEPTTTNHDNGNPAVKNTDSTQNNNDHLCSRDNSINDEGFQGNIVSVNTADSRDTDIRANDPVHDNENEDIIAQFEENDDEIEGNNGNNNGENGGGNNENNQGENGGGNNENNNGENGEGNNENNNGENGGGNNGQNGQNNGANNNNEDDQNNVDQDRRETEKMKQFVVNSIKYYKAAEGPGFEERQRRYNTADGEIYLGENISVPALEWEMANLERPTIFLILVAQMLWHPHDLANRALEINGNMTNIPGRSPIKLIETQRLRLLISLYHDYLKRDKCLERVSKASYLLKATYILRTKIRNLRRQEIRATNPRNARRILRYNVQ